MITMKCAKCEEDVVIKGVTCGKCVEKTTERKRGHIEAAEYLREVEPGQSVDRAQFLLRMAREIEELP